MGWFNKTEKKGPASEMPKLPELPELPELPGLGKEELPQLPSFPPSYTGDKFSQSAIKEAVTGKEEGDTGVEADESIGTRMMQKPPIPYSKDIEEAVPREFKAAAKMVKEAEPVFVRIDKFEKALDIFEKTKDKITDVEKMLRDIRKLKEKEQEELEGWEREIQTTKQQIERVDKELFSKIE